MTGKVKRDLWTEKGDFYFFGDYYSRHHDLSNATTRSFLTALVFHKFATKYTLLIKKKSKKESDSIFI